MNNNFTIHKYELTLLGENEVQMPYDARILTAQFQDDSLVIWAIVHPLATPKKRVFHVYYTGGLIPIKEYLKGFLYISTCQNKSGIVCHIFEELNHLLP